MLPPSHLAQGEVMSLKIHPAKLFESGTVVKKLELEPDDECT
jgi:hypothetical protein